MLCVHKTSPATAQAVELDLSTYAGRSPVEMFGKRALPAGRRIAIPAYLSAAGLSTGSL